MRHRLAAALAASAAMAAGLLTPVEPASALVGSCGVTGLAHRGAHLVNDENTVASLEGAYGHEAGSEHDVFITKDGYFVVIHDATVDRTTDGTGYVNDLTLAEIRELNTTPHGDKVPTLKQLLGAASNNTGQLLNLELKGPGWTADANLVKLQRTIKSNGVLKRAYVASDAGDYLLTRLRDVVPAVKTAWKPDASVKVTTTAARQLSVDAVMAWPAQLDAALVDRLHARGLAAWSRLVNESQAWGQLARIGVDAVLTDRPSAFRSWCAEQ